MKERWQLCLFISLVVPVACVLQSLAKRREEVDLIRWQSILNKSLRQHPA